MFSSTLLVSDAVGCYQSTQTNPRISRRSAVTRITAHSMRWKDFNVFVSKILGKRNIISVSVTAVSAEQKHRQQKGDYSAHSTVECCYIASKLNWLIINWLTGYSYALQVPQLEWWTTCELIETWVGSLCYWDNAATGVQWFYLNFDFRTKKVGWLIVLIPLASVDINFQ